MRWLRVAYSMRAAACLTLAAVHLLVWFKQPARRTHLAFSVIAIFVAAIKPFEFVWPESKTPEQYIQHFAGFTFRVHDRITTPGNVVGAPSFGQITNTRFPTGESGSSRQIQFAMRLMF